MLNSLRIQNFKSWKDTSDIQFGSITGFFGTNSSGKTSILQFLLMLKQTVESSDRAQVLNLGDDNSYVELGTIYDIIHEHSDPGTLDFSIEWKPPIPLGEVFFPGIKIDKKFVKYISINTQIISNKNLLYLNKFYYSLNKKESIIGIEHILSDKKEVVYSAVINEKQFNNLKNKTKAVNPKKFYSYDFPLGNIDWHVASLMLQISSSFEQELANAFYLGPLREYPKRLYPWSGDQTSSVGNRGERAIAALLASRNSKPTIVMGKGQAKRTVEQHVAYWLKELRLIHSFEVRPIAPNRKEYEVRIKRTAESAEVFLTDVGFGVSQLLPVLVLLFYVPEGSTIILEQPEIHLHPAVQAGLADVFIDAIKRRNVQIILESHSEHLLQRLQLRMAEKGLNPDKEFDSTKANLYFTSIEKGESKLMPLQLDEYGNINNWPNGFFGDTLGEAAAMMKAEMKRKMH